MTRNAAVTFRRLLSLLIFSVFFAPASIPPAMAQRALPVVGSQNTSTADPPVAVPDEKPCVVPLYSNLEFADFSAKTYQYTPACPGPWKKVVFAADFNVTAGRQFDRTAQVSLGHVNIFYGTTPEPTHTFGPSWHVERDLTDYSALFESSQSGEVDLGNLVNSTYTGIIFGSASLQFYSAHHGGDSEGHRALPDAVYPLPNASGGAKALFNTTDQLSETFTLPTNIERAYLDVISQSQSNDEFWYSCVPSDVANELQSCGNSGFRETEVAVDGQPAGVAPVYPWIFTGGIDPYLWSPIPGVQTLNFVPYRVDLTPFAGLLSDGQPHAISLSVFNANSYFLSTATLLVYLDHGSEQVTGEITGNTLASAPNPTVTENLQTDLSGNITGSVVVASDRSFKISGFVRTSHGKVETDVLQSIKFSNTQNFTINATHYIQDITQATGVESRTIAHERGLYFASIEAFRYPLTLNITETFNTDGTLSLQTTSEQKFKHDLLDPFFASAVENSVSSTDTLQFDSSFNLTGHSGQQSSQHFHAANSRGHEYNCTLSAASNILTSVSESCQDTGNGPDDR
jgi:hypothetical protein